MKAGKMLLTGGSGRLGTELQQLLPGIQAPASHELNILSSESIEQAIQAYQPSLLIHAAAFTDVAGAEQRRADCWSVNVEGTRLMVQGAERHALPLVYISTDYVFWGEAGNYREDDPPGPVRNYYSLTKLAAEAVVSVLPRRLIIRTSFRPRSWPYPKAFTDLFTSQDYVDVLAPEIALALQRWEEIPYSVLHIVGERKSVYELARQRRPDVQAASKTDAAVALPDDISLNRERWLALKSAW